jgi:hypothetical protein
MNVSTSNILSPNKLTLLFFYADGSSLREIDGIEKHVTERLPSIDFLKIDMRTNPQVGSSFQVYETPSLMVLQNGKEIWRRTISFSESELYTYLQEVKSINKIN